MKRMVCFMLCLILPAAAYALSDLDIMVEGHNPRGSVADAR